ncbi:reverse transcriptase domain-containing protein [Tanacetum coccineum]
MEAYVGDMVIKSMDEEDMLAYIQQTFKRLQRINMKLNPKKLSFGMEEGRFLGHVVSKQGIKSNPLKIQALTSLKRPKPLRKYKTREADKAFEDMKKYIEKLPTLVAPKAGESLIVYLAAFRECVSAILMAERGKDQRPVYFVNMVLQGAELNYPIMEKLVLALVYAARRLKRSIEIAGLTFAWNYFSRISTLSLDNQSLLLQYSRDGYVIEGELKEYEDSCEKSSVQVFYKEMLNQYHRVSRSFVSNIM